MKAKKMIVPILMGVLMAFAILPMTAGKAYAEDYGLWVGGERVTSDNALSIPWVGGGTASYNATSKTLTLNGVTIPEDNAMGIPTGILSRIPDLKIKVYGENQLSGQSVGIHSTGSITITGDGSLQAKGSDNGIESDGGVTITDATVTATSGNNGIYSRGAVTIKDATVTATGNAGSGIEASGEIKIEGSSKVDANGGQKAIFSGNKKITLGDGLFITAPVNGRVSNDGKDIIDQNGDPATSVTIERVVKMNGEGTTSSPYEITCYADLQEFASIVNGKHQAPQNTAACGKLMDNITCDDKDWVPIGKDQTNPYEGHFNGNNHVISGLSNADITDVSPYQGLFGINKGTVEKVGIKSGNIKGNNDIGGVVGYNYAGTITNCYNTGAVSGTGKRVGGVAGINVGTITNCYNTGAVSGEGDQVGGVAGINSGGITNCYNTGTVSGGENVGGVAGINNGEKITNCYNTGAVSGKSYVGGVAGHNGGGITNCYNTGEVSVGGSYVGGVAGYNTSGNIQRGEITNCYNTGAVSGEGDQVGGVVGRNNGGTITSCYNTGAVRGAGGTVGGVAGWQYGGTITICYYDKAFSMVTKAVGNADDTEDVKGLTTSQMTGETALENMRDFAATAWIVKANGKDADSRTYYEYYPHLKGFAYTSDPVVANWPAKAIVDADWNEPDSYTYNASDQKPTVTRVTVSQKPVEVPKGMTAVYSNKNDSGWDETSPTAPTVPGTYKMTIRNSDEVIDEIVFIILEPDVDYTVAYQKQEGEDPAVWSTDTVKPIAAGTYKAVVTRTGGTVLGEKVFQIEPASIAATVNGSSTEKTYNGVEQTYTGTVTAASSDTAFDATKFQYTGSAEAKGTNVGDHIAELNAGNCTYADPNYKVTWAIGDPVKLTIEPVPLTIKAKDQTYEYDGQPHGEGDPAYDDPAVIAGKVEANGLQNGDEITSLVLDGAEKEIGVYKDRIQITGFTINGKPEAKDNYNITLLPGTLTITKPQPKPEPQPQTETAKIAPKAMTAKGKNALTIHWRKVSGAQGYDIFFSRCGKDTRCKLTKTIKGNSTFSWTKTGLKTKTPYKAYVKGWVMKDGKKKYISTSPTLHLYTANGTNNYTVAKSIKVKKTKVKLNVGKKYKIKAKIIKRDKTKKLMPAIHTKQLRYISTNKKIATVSKSGKIKAKAKGSCKIYVYAANGVSKAVKVTVK